MIETFESTARTYPDRAFLTFVDNEGREVCYTYRQTRLIAAAMAKRLQDKGICRGDYVTVDLPNCPEYVFLALAAGYGSFTLVCLNARLTAAEKHMRVADLERIGLRIACDIDAARAKSLMNYVCSIFENGYAYAQVVDDGLAAGSEYSPELAYVGGGARYGSDGTQQEVSHRRAHGRGAASYSRMRDGRYRQSSAAYDRGAVAYAGVSGSVLRNGRHHSGPIGAAYASEANCQASSSGSDSRFPRTHSILGTRRDVFEDTVHFAEREAHLFDSERRAVVMFTSGTTGKAKAVALTWDQLDGAAQASNKVLSVPARGMWQAALPFYHIGGFQVIVRSVLNRTPLRAYASFEPDRVLKDAKTHNATHVSVVDKMLQDMLSCKNANLLEQYSCVLLGGGALNPVTVNRSLDAGVALYASYGMTETSSQIADSKVTVAFDGGLRLLPGYSARIVDADKDGFGRLAVRGPGVFDGYLNARAAFTVDGFFLTGDTAALHDDCLYVRERTEDMFVSGGENVYPAEIAQALLRLPGIADAQALGVEDPTWGRRPVAFVEPAKEADGTVDVPACDAPSDARLVSDHAAGARPSDPAETAQTFSLAPTSLRRALSRTLSKLYLPKHIIVLDSLPRSGIGKIDRVALMEAYANRLQAERIVLYHVRLPFKKPFKTARATLTHRDLILVEITDHAGRVGLGECVSFTTDWYLPETLGEDAKALQEELIPLVKDQAFLHPREVSRLFDRVPEACAHPMACSAIEMAFWDLYGKVTGEPLWKSINREYERLAQKMGMPASGRPSCSTPLGAVSVGTPAGAVVGLESAQDTVRQVANCVAAGYKRIKMKISPETSLSVVRKVREAFPQVLLTLDANRSFLPSDWTKLIGYDDLNIGWIEEPLAFGEHETRDEAFARLAALQHHVVTPICIDETVTNYEDALRALSFPEIKLLSVKIAKFGGIWKALDFIVRAQASGRDVWMSGMYDTGVSRRVHAAFQTLPGLIFPGDIGGTGRYFNTDVTDPAYAIDNGSIVLNPEGHEAGIGCDLEYGSLAGVLMQRCVFE